MLKNYIVEVPVYISLTLAAQTPELAAEAGRDFVNENVVGETDLRTTQNGIRIERKAIEPLGKDEDHTPDVYEVQGGKLVSVFHEGRLED